MLLTHLGFPFNFIKWIMSCITNIPFSVLINGAASAFFHSERGLRQGYPLSPILFLLIMEGLSNLVKEEFKRSILQGIKITEGCILTHLDFVDDVLLFLNGRIGDLKIMKNTFALFQSIIGMTVNSNKSTLTEAGRSPYEIHYALQRFHFTLLRLEEELKYLGYNLKLLGYKIAYWTWIISNMEKRLNIWYYKYLSRAGRLILIKPVLEATPVYWMSLAWICRGILSRI